MLLLYNSVTLIITTKKVSTKIHPKRGTFVGKNVHENSPKVSARIHPIFHENWTFMSTRILLGRNLLKMKPWKESNIMLAHFSLPHSNCSWVCCLCSIKNVLHLAVQAILQLPMYIIGHEGKQKRSIVFGAGRLLCTPSFYQIEP